MISTKRIKERLKLLKGISILKTLYFNFHYFRFSQAILLPVYLYNPQFIRLRGNVVLPSKIKSGMIVLGKHKVSIYPDTGISLEINGTLEFKGYCTIGSGSFLSIHNSGHLKLGERCVITQGIKIVCYKSIEFGKKVLCGWDCLVMDTDLHQLSDTQGVRVGNPCLPVRVGDESWISFQTTIMKGTIIPDRSVVASRSLCNKDYGVTSYVLIAGTPAKIIKKGIWRYPTNDHIDYNRL